MGLVFHMNDPTGHTAEWHGGDAWLNWKPLGVAAFRENILNRGALEMTLEDAMTSVRGPVTNFSGKGQVTFVWPSDLPIKVFGLVPRGWLPAAVCESTLLLPDANLAGAFSLLDDEASRNTVRIHDSAPQCRPSQRRSRRWREPRRCSDRGRGWLTT